MPHTPRRFASTTGISPELLQRPVDHHPPIPIRRGEKRSEEPQTPQGKRRRLGLGKLNMHTYEPDPVQLLKTLFGKEPTTNGYTGQLVLANNASFTARPGTQNPGADKPK